MTVKASKFCAVRSCMFDHHDITPTFASIFSVNNLTVGGCVNRLTAISIAAGLFIPVLAQVAVFPEILNVMPVVCPIVFLSNKIRFSDGVSETFRGESQKE